MRNLRTWAMLPALLCACAATASTADEDAPCPAGEFETDLAKISQSFGKPDIRRLKQARVSGWEPPAEIARIRYLVVADTGSNTVRRVSRDGIVTTIAGLAGVKGSSDGLGTHARFNEPEGIAVDSHGYLYVADTSNQTLRKIAPDGRVTTLAGRAGSRGTRDGSSAARLEDPSLVVVDSAGTVYLANGLENSIRRVSASGVVTTLDAESFIERAELEGPW